MLTLTSLTIWHWWKQAGSIGSRLVGSMLDEVDVASLVAQNLDLI